MGIKVAIEIEGDLTVHIPGASGNYATLCGLDGNDDHEDVQQRTVELPSGSKINCKDCKAIWLVAKGYQSNDFE